MTRPKRCWQCFTRHHGFFTVHTERDDVRLVDPYHLQVGDDILHAEDIIKGKGVGIMVLPESKK